MATAPAAKGNGKVAMIAGGVAVAMLGLGYASVPLYRLFCQATGFGGTTQRASEAQAASIKLAGKTIRVRFDTNVARDFPWEFRPEQKTQDPVIGQRKMATFYARNTSNRPILGTAIFNVSPEQAGKYFNKIQCFCFNEQRLEPGQEARMPVIYYVDPAILKDPDANDVQEITLSYTFMESPDSPKPAGGKPAGGARLE